jgi:hypothetical protein
MSSNTKSIVTSIISLICECMNNDIYSINGIARWRIALGDKFSILTKSFFWAMKILTVMLTIWKLGINALLIRWRNIGRTVTLSRLSLFFAPFVLQFKPTESLRLFLKMPIVAPCYATSYYDSLILTLSKNMTTLLLNYIYNKYFT